jgi:thiaminase
VAPFQCYLDAWTYASSQTKNVDKSLTSEGDGGVVALHQEFIPNWTCEPFRDFVKRLASVTDAWAAKLDARDMETCKYIWLDVLELEAKFWPDV